MPSPSDFTRAGIGVSHALVATCKRPTGMSDFQVQRRIDEIMGTIYQAKLEFLAKVDELAQEAIELALVEKTKKGFPSDEERLQCDAYALIRQGIDQANTGLDAARTGIGIAGRAFRMARMARKAKVEAQA
ncbi:MAG: hypothetical protein AB7U59_01085 [Desulfovibrionaceae bacterium]